jgi:SAM-dependent methyltransferase
LDFPTGDLSLAFCEACGFIWNRSFDARLVEYSPRCEETQGFSPAFREWQLGLARRLIDRYELRDKTILEIGCGKGEFLELLCELGGNRGWGFDPAYVPGRTGSGNGAGVEFVRDNYSERYAGHRADFVCCKMTLEHIHDANEFVGMLRRSLSDAPDTRVFFQVPDVLRILRDIAFWDIYYEHCSYYSIGSLSRLFQRVGFEVLGLSREYDNQYLTLEARPADNGRRSLAPEESDLGELMRLVSGFESQMQSVSEAWKARLEEYQRKGLRVVIWGSGSKGVGFLTVLGGCTSTIEYVVDINPNRHGNFMAGTGQRIVGPGFLKEYHPDVVIVMNAMYRKEIVSELERQRVQAEVITT